MPRRQRDRTAGLVFHVLNRAAKRTVLFDNSSDYYAFEDLLEEAAQRIQVAIFAYCIMPNHWHLVITPRVDGALSRFMHWLTTTHARRWQMAHGAVGLGAVYQGRFKAIPIGSDRHFLWTCRYVERNALRASLVDRAEDWRWSSLHNSAFPWLAQWPTGRPANWTAEVNTPQTEAELEYFRNAMRNGHPFGEEEWAEAIRCGRQWPFAGVRGRRAKAVGECPLEMTPDPI
jgi:putative transposase